MARSLIPLSVLFLACNPAEDLSACVERLPEVIDSDFTASAGCWLMGPTSVQEGATLTIEAGTTIAVEADGFLDVGPYNGPEALVAVGTEADPIRFTSVSASPLPGDWQCVRIGEGATASELAYVSMAYGGAPCDYNGAGNTGELIVEAELRGVTNSEFTDSLTHGVRLHQPPRAFDDNRFAGNGEASIYSRRNAVLGLGTGLTFDDADDHIRVAEFTLNATGTWLGQPVPFVLEGGFELGSGGDVTLDQGLELRLDGGSFAVFDAALDVAGDPTNPVVFTSAEATPMPGDWGCLSYDAPRSTPSIANAVFQFGGGGQGCTGADYEALLNVPEGTPITGSVFRDSAGGGIRSVTCDTDGWCLNDFGENGGGDPMCGFDQAPVDCP
jgi:hypothetical protein